MNGLFTSESVTEGTPTRSPTRSRTRCLTPASRRTRARVSSARRSSRPGPWYSPGSSPRRPRSIARRSHARRSSASATTTRTSNSRPHGGGAFSGKDPSKVDRSGAYAARHIARNIVAGDLAARCVVQLAYAIGVAEPVSLFVDTFGTGRLPDTRLARAIADVFDLRPGAFRQALALHRPIYTPTAAYGHFGRHDLDLAWERTDRAADLREVSRC